MSQFPKYTNLYPKNFCKISNEDNLTPLIVKVDLLMLCLL